MPLMTIFYIVVGVTVLGIIYVLYLINQKGPQVDPIVQKIEPEEVTGLTDQLSVEGNGLEEAAPEVKKRGFLGGMTKGKSEVSKPMGVIEPEASDNQDLDMPTKVKSGGFWAKLTSKIGKNKENPLDDIPEPTPLPSLQEHLDTLKKGQSKRRDQGQEEDTVSDSGKAVTGTAAMRTTSVAEQEQSSEKMNVPKESVVEGNNSPDLPIAKPSESMERELEASSQLEALKAKYKKLDEMFQEKSEELQKADNTLMNEMKNRQDFDKLKELLEGELRDVKGRARELQQSLRDARMETEFQKNQAVELKEQISQLEVNLDKKDDALDKIQFKASQDESKNSTNSIEDSSVIGGEHQDPEVKPKTPAQIEKELGLRNMSAEDVGKAEEKPGQD